MDPMPELDHRTAGVQDPLRRPAPRHCKLTVTPSQQPDQPLLLTENPPTQKPGHPPSCARAIMGTLGLCPLELTRPVLLGRFARGGGHNPDARLPRVAGEWPSA